MSKLNIKKLKGGGVHYSLNNSVSLYKTKNYFKGG